MKRFTFLVLLLAMALVVAPRAPAAVYTLTDLNSSVFIDDQSQAGAYNWTIDGVDILWQQWFWYRVGNVGGQTSLDALPVVANQGTPESLDLTYTGNGFTVAIEYDLTGGLPGTLTSDIAETITIHNTGTTSLDFHFFQYSDFDLNQVNRADVVTINPTLRFVDQVPFGMTGPMLTETIVTPRPSHAEANFFANTLNALNSGNPLTLNDNLIAGPGDVTWAFQWDKTIGAGGSFIISKDKNVAPVPEPAPLALLGGTLILLARKLRHVIS